MRSPLLVPTTVLTVLLLGACGSDAPPPTRETPAAAVNTAQPEPDEDDDEVEQPRVKVVGLPPPLPRDPVTGRLILDSETMQNEKPQIEEKAEEPPEPEQPTKGPKDTRSRAERILAGDTGADALMTANEAGAPVPEAEPSTPRPSAVRAAAAAQTYPEPSDSPQGDVDTEPVDTEPVESPQADINTELPEEEP